MVSVLTLGVFLVYEISVLSNSLCASLSVNSECLLCCCYFLFAWQSESCACLWSILAISITACEKLGTRRCLGWHTGRDNHHLSCSCCVNEWNLFILQLEHCLLCIKALEASYKSPLWAVSHCFWTFLLLGSNISGAGDHPSSWWKCLPVPTTQHNAKNLIYDGLGHVDILELLVNDSSFQTFSLSSNKYKFVNKLLKVSR